MGDKNHPQRRVGRDLNQHMASLLRDAKKAIINGEKDEAWIKLSEYNSIQNSVPGYAKKIDVEHARVYDLYRNKFS